MTLSFVANWSDEEDRHEWGPDFQDLDDAIQWARERAPVVIVMLGFSSPVWFSAGDREPGRESPGNAPLPHWPPSDELLAKLLSDTHVPTNWGRTDVILEDESEA